MVELITISIITASILGFSVVFNLAVHSSGWITKLGKALTRSRYRVTSVYRISDEPLFNMVVQFIDKVVNSSKSSKRHFVTYRIKGRGYMTIQGNHHIKASIDISEERRKELNTSNKKINFWLYGMGAKDAVCGGFEIWVSPKYQDDVNRVLLAFGHELGYNTIANYNLFRMKSSLVRTDCLIRIMNYNFQLIQSKVDFITRTALLLPDASNVTVDQLMSARDMDPHTLTWAGIIKSVKTVHSCPNELRRGMIELYKSYPKDVARLVSAGLIINNLNTFLLMKADEYSLSVKLNGQTVQECMQSDGYTVDTFFSDIVEQHKDVPFVKELVENVYLYLQIYQCKGDVASCMKKASGHQVNFTKFIMDAPTAVYTQQKASVA